MTRWVYEMHILGQLSDRMTARIQSEVGDIVSTTEPVRTLVRGSVADQAALVGLLNLVHTLGLEVCEVRRVAEMPTETKINSISPGNSANRCEQGLPCNE